MIEDEKAGLQPMDISDASVADVESKDFLTSLFDCEGKSDDRMLRYADAIIDVQNLNFDVSPQCLQSNIAEIITKFVLLSQDGSRRGLSRSFNFIDPDIIAGCREEDAIEFLLINFVRCHHELGKSGTSNCYKKTLESTRKAVFSVFVMIQRGYLESQLRSQHASLVFTKRLLEDTVSNVFLRTLVEYLASTDECDEDAITETFNPIFGILRSGIICQRFEDNKDEIVRQILRVMNLLLSIRLPSNGPRPLSNLLVNREDFLPTPSEKIQGREFGLMSFLGPFFSYGLESSARRPNHRVFVDCEEDARKYDGSVNTEQKLYFQRMDPIRTMLHQLMLPLASDQGSRNKTLRWIATIISTNDIRTRSHYDPSDVLCDHYMTNFLSVMYMFSEKIDLSKIIVDYPFLPSSLINISKETRLKMDESGAVAFASQFDRPDEYHFSTVCFFLTIAAQRLVIPPLMNQISEYSRHLKELKHKINALKEKLNTVSGFERAEVEKKLNYETEHWKLMSRHLLCVKTQAQDPALMASSMDFVDKQMKFILNLLCDNLDLLGDDSQLPTEVSQMFCALPEYFLEDALDFYIFAISNGMKLLMERNADWISRLTVLFTQYHYIKSPFLVSKLVRVLSSIQPPLWFNVVRLRMAQENLLMCMIKFYSDFEDNGDFYEKFNVRGNIQYMLEKMEEDMFYKGKFMDMARECGAEFIRFVNMVINDATWCIDESLSGLKSIHDVEKKMANKVEWDNTDQEIRNQDLGVYEEAKRKVKGWLGTAKSNLKLLLSITVNSPEPFRTPVLGERLAAMLNHNLSQLIGSKASELKVKDPRSYGWEPREFVSLLISIYLKLNMPAFVKYIAYDERTYSPEFFHNAIECMRKNSIVGFSQLESFEHLAEDVKKEYEAKAELEEEYDDVPEEFKDPIMDAIMVDPVKLPSGHVMDRAVIERHLLSTPNNPFNRAPLSHNELSPDSELKAKIQEWICQKRNSKK
ncbi:Ubiquitin conjugation factor E4 ufd-2 [Caenorhabditis elegans]|uniref:Isoform c of Ubiquitin conjugation factor E4 ufd-2 n=1 Tax=Caenorhabditis elegans TaxID=6239 RepID=Q09349-4|nr:Ubiquitin conjugation factor E4 ufd-2 [Caenorhabditis elegans]CAH04720.1 Ubiquitin conjugation factor E4 ufd-2 [Caenorhabditis elegans]|eukprot:NP_001022320.1 Ubiquitin conjugation factor E4 ufd-2 [Caenorhabditis elegans]